MNTPTLPPNHELLQPDFLRQHGAVKGMMYNLQGNEKWHACDWSYSQVSSVGLDVITLCAPSGTVAAATTPVPDGRCECGAFGRRLPCEVFCPKNPRNAYVHILPHQLAQLPEKPEGLIERFGNNCPQGQKDNWSPSPIQWPFTMEGDLDIVAFAVRQHEMDRIEQQLSTKGGDEPCADSHASNTAGVAPAHRVPTAQQGYLLPSASNAAPESSDPTGEAAPSDTEMLDWLEKQTKASSTGISFDWCRYAEEGHVVEHGFRFMRRHFLGERKSTLRSAITAAMKEDRK